MKSAGNGIIANLNHEIEAIVKQSESLNQFSPSSEKWTYADLFTDKMFVVQLIKTGISYNFFELIQTYTPFSENDWAKFLDLSTKSLQRYKQASKNFRPLQSEKIIEMAEVTNIGLDVFGEMDKFKLWLHTPSFALGNLKPVELLNDSYGKEMVISELTRINYGILV